jgi:hypothetical protein
MVWRFLLWGMGRVIDIGSGLGSDSGALLEFTGESGFLGLRKHGSENNTSPFARTVQHFLCHISSTRHQLKDSHFYNF